MNQIEPNRTTEKQLKAIPKIIFARSISEGLRAAKVAKSTFYKWLREDDFKKEFERQRRAHIDEAFHILKISASEAVKSLKDLLKSKSETVRLRAATSILDHVIKSIERDEIEQRLLNLERSINKE